eukprot:TRINITY_DN2844_c0_g1_i3.p1 TRINITY_DN2844_c0_g1~~TRINITY_DN2844_c0_g1_i3.p1  ORF type:complete len:215 (-),score=41.35 TRINITY_DN2844_c0_g1_i3:252-896(-)
MIKGGAKVMHGQSLDSNTLVMPSPTHAKKVPVVLYIMSRCPDASTCLRTFDQVAESVGEIMDIKTEFITHNLGGTVTCSHGERECDGNKAQLCAQKISNDTMRAFQFSVCQTTNFMRVPDNTVDCGKQLGLDIAKLQECIRDDSAALLRESGSRTESLGIKRSCTIYVNNAKVCIKDGSWYDCPQGHEVSDFVKQICRSYRGGKRPTACHPWRN